MAIYLEVTAKARIKIQDPYDEKTIAAAQENIHLHCVEHELLDEDYKFKVEDAD